MLFRSSKSTVPGSVIVGYGFGSFGYRVAQDTRHQFGMNHAFSGLADGTYIFGMCGDSPAFADWNSNEYGYITLMVVN